MTVITRLQKEIPWRDLIELSKQFFYEYEVHHDEFFKIDQLCEDDIVSYFSSFLGAEDRAAIIALAEGEIVGYITIYIQPQPGYWKIKQFGHISGLMVRQDHRRQGIGRQLITAAQVFFKEKGVKYWTVYTAANNQPALDLYARSGMTPLYTTFINRVE